MKEKEKPKSNNPLLYIAQPNIQEPNNRMQSQYHSISDSPAVSNRIENVTANQSKAKKRSAYFNEEEEFIFQSEEKKIEEKQYEEKQLKEKAPVSAADYFRFHAKNSRSAGRGLKPVKSFSAMTIEEKLHHLSTTSQFYSCIFSTPERRVVGKLYKVFNESFVVKADSGEYFTIEKNALTDIRINA